jgi:hypothetical protein
MTKIIINCTTPVQKTPSHKQKRVCIWKILIFFSKIHNIIHKREYKSHNLQSTILNCISKVGIYIISLPVCKEKNPPSNQPTIE